MRIHGTGCTKHCILLWFCTQKKNTRRWHGLDIVVFTTHIVYTIHDNMYTSMCCNCTGMYISYI